MTELTSEQAETLRDRVIVALDVDTIDEACSLVDSLAPHVERFKIGSRMFTGCGPAVLDAIAERGAKIFLDLKYHDIPSVIGDACRIVSENHPAVFLLTVHASGGPAMVCEAVEGAIRDDLDVVAVTALTSLSPSETRILGVDLSLDNWVIKLSELALEAGAAGLVCSPNEVKLMRETHGSKPILVTPGIRPGSQQPGDDQARVMTPADAIAAGSTYLVMGRPIYQAADPLAAALAVGASF